MSAITAQAAADLPAVHPGDARADLGRHHEARVHPAVFPRRPHRGAQRAALLAHPRRDGVGRAGAQSDPPRRLAHRWVSYYDEELAAEEAQPGHVGDRAPGRRHHALTVVHDRLEERSRPPRTSPAPDGCTSSAASRRCSRPAHRSRLEPTTELRLLVLVLLDRVGQRHPRMPPRLVDGDPRRREGGIGERPDRHGYEGRLRCGRVEDRRGAQSGQKLNVRSSPSSEMRT